MALTHSAGAALWSEYILRDFIPTLEANLIFCKHCAPAILPKHEGSGTARWNLMANLTPSILALTEASATDNEVEATASAVSADLTEYGQWTKLSSLAYNTMNTTALDSWRKRFVYDGAVTLERLAYAQGLAGTNFHHCTDTTTGGTTLAVSSLMNAGDLAVIANFFHDQDAQPFSHLEDHYFLGVNPFSEYNLVSDVTNTRLSWSNIKMHTPSGYDNLRKGSESIPKGYVGALNGVAVFRTTTITSAGTITEDVDAWANLAMAEDGVGWVGLGKGRPKPEIPVKTSGPNDTSNALNMFSTIGWKIQTAFKLLDTKRVLTVYNSIT
jgi:N4-gp56 family major capsid protein